MKTLGEIRSGFFLSDLLLGSDRLSEAERGRYQTFFREVVRQRGFPLHTASFWNALYFGWDLDEQGYLGRGLRLTLAKSGPPIPVGSIVEVQCGKRILWAEVVYKEGRDPGIDRDLGVAEPAVSGTRVKIARSLTDVRLHEALVLDFDAFGEDFNDYDVTLDRAARKGWLTSDRHLEVDADYGHADADELLLFARHVMDEYGSELFNEALRDGGSGVTRDERWQLLLSSLQAVEELAVSAPGLQTFGHYHLDSSAYQARLRSSDGLFGRDGLMTVARSLVSPGSRRKAYTAAGPLVHEYLARGGGIDPNEQDLLDGPSYARLVLEANTTAAGLVGHSGFVDGAYARLDDEYQGGGVWRAVTVNGDRPTESAWNPLVPLGLGYAETASGLVALVPPCDDPEPPIIEASDKGWRVALRLVDLDRRELPLPPAALAMLPSDATEVLVEFDDGLGTKYPRKMRPIDRERRVVGQMLFGATLYPGVYVRCSVGFGGRLVSIHTLVLPMPAKIGDRLLRLDFDEATYRREILHERLEHRSVANARTLVDQIAAVFRLRGRQMPDGGRALSSTEVAAAILGPAFDPEIAKPIVLALQSGGYGYHDRLFIWQPQVDRLTSPQERQRIIALRASAQGARLAQRLLARQVPMHLRRQNPSAGKVSSYARSRLEFHATRLPERLPPGRTWVRPFEIGG